MAITREVKVWRDDFDRAQALTTTPGQNGWTIKDTSTTGTPTYLCASADGGALVLTLEATSEAQYVTAFHNDVLNFRLDKLIYVEFNLKVAGINSVTTLVVGVSSAARGTHTQVPDAETYNAWIRMEGSVSTANIVVETDDTVTDKDDIATGKTLAAATSGARSISATAYQMCGFTSMAIALRPALHST